MVKRVLVDSGSLADIITLECLKKLKYSQKDVTLLDQPLIGFGENSVHPVGSIKLPTRMAEKGKGRSLPIDFLVVDIPLPYNIIMGRPTLNRTKAAISTYQLLMQFEMDDRKVGKIQGDQQAGRECYLISLKSKADIDAQKDSKKRKREDGPTKGIGVYIAENPKQYERPQPAEEDEEVVIGGEPGRTVRVGKALDPQTRAQVMEVLREYQDVVKNPSGAWHMCVDFTDLNKACPKDNHPLPKIDRLVDSTAGHALLSFMDANAGYHQIPMAEHDRVHTAFTTPQGVYCYKMHDVVRLEKCGSHLPANC
ncbi:uncharacterized protein LOC104907571 [Beta vulgaris subsp. vulgaris]|uniref:uncharacterized protein LOC104907571 n=1 Tax=Beta vulgaris subsp. vulgaris TaxID=3555 RepID=UPI0020376326|nr:uncharacterized protein LOC104907571 [Beta vulgaris subsp. vulgaris]